MSNVDDVRAKIEEYQNRYGLRQTQISELYDLKEDWKADKSWYLAEAKGVYAILDDQEELLYIGKASLGSSLGARLSFWFVGSAEGGVPVPSHNWSRPPRFVLTVAVEYSYEAPSLEEFLIKSLQPIDNAQGK